MWSSGSEGRERLWELPTLRWSWRDGLLATCNTCACPEGGEREAEADLGEWGIEELPCLITPPHTRCEHRGRPFELPEGPC